MKFLADENFPLKSLYRLREAGLDVKAVIEESPGIKDREVLAWAADEGRILLTFDRDYGELIYRRGLSAPTGVIYFRFIPETPEEVAEYLLKLIEISGLRLEGRFTVVERDRVRQRLLP